jgi:hypothetical protein
MELYDDFAQIRINEDKWQIGAVPLGDDQLWHYRDSNAEVSCRDGRGLIDITQFSQCHDQVPRLDNPKHLYLATRSWDTSQGRVSIKTTMAGHVTGDVHDYRDGFAAFNVLDFASAMVFDIVTNGRHIWAIFERLLIPGQTTPEEAFTEVIELEVSTAPMREHVFQVSYDRAAGSVHYAVDGRERLVRTRLPVEVEQLTTGFGLITLQPIQNGRSTSCRGQGGKCRIGPVYVGT